MTELEIRENMAQAFREDRERLFKVIDSMRPQPRFADKLTEIEAVAQEWRDKPSLLDFPNIDHPTALPIYFPSPHFASSWVKDEYIQKMLESVEEVVEEEVMEDEVLPPVEGEGEV